MKPNRRDPVRCMRANAVSNRAVSRPLCFEPSSPILPSKLQWPGRRAEEGGDVRICERPETRVTWREQDPRQPEGSLVYHTSGRNTTGVRSRQRRDKCRTRFRSKESSWESTVEEDEGVHVSYHHEVNYQLLSVNLTGVNRPSRQANACDSGLEGCVRWALLLGPPGESHRLPAELPR